MTATLPLPTRSALVTGASKGIGAAIARRPALQGAAVAITYRTDQSGAHRLVEELRQMGCQAAAFPADISDHAPLGASRVGRVVVASQ